MDRRQNAARRAIRAIVRQTGGIRRAERELRRRHPDQARYPSAGLISQIAHGVRRPQPWLCDLLGIPEPERKTRPKPVPWKRVSLKMASSMIPLRMALLACGVEQGRTDEIMRDYWNSEEAM